MKKTIFLKLFGGYVVIVLVLSLLIPVFTFSKIRIHYEETLGQELLNLGRALNVSILPFLEQGQFRELDAFVKKTGKDIHARITVIEPDGRVLGDSEADSAQMENHRYRPEVAEALEGNIGRSLRFSYTVEQNMLYVGLPVESGGRVIGVTRLSLFTKNIEVLLRSLRMTIVRTIVIAALGALGLALLVSLHFVGPIRRLTKASKQVTEGQFGAKVAIRHKDEFRSLANAFNAMTERIQQLFADVTNRKDEINHIVTSLDEGLLVVNKEGRIVLANESVKNIVEETQLENKFVWEVIRRPKLLEFIGRMMSAAEPASIEIQIDDRYFLCTAAGLRERGGIVLTLHDVTVHKRAEIMKRDFVVNASHELRTPLSALLGAAETLEESFPRLNTAAMDILKRNIERLRLIVEDLMKLAELEDRVATMEIHPIDLRRLTESVVEVFAPRAKRKNLDIRLESQPELPLLPGDPHYIEQLLVNLIDNAVKYTDQGKIEIRLGAVAASIVIEVEDTGVGIPSEHLPRIFERFYVVDKSRSRRLGGTGLGLSIVKHIVERHHGTISVSSIEGQGTTFTVHLPR
jgi:two-component system, OmpR family, phosphate regulon sensor histidine kinase PhoR